VTLFSLDLIHALQAEGHPGTRLHRRKPHLEAYVIRPFLTSLPLTPMSALGIVTSSGDSHAVHL
jgi:hypothetical protein